MYVRLAFAVAAHLDSEILIIDEVLAVGDAEFQKKCLGKMGEVSRGEGRTVLFVSHQMGTIAQLCNKAVLLKNGELKVKGNVNEVVNNYLAGNNTQKSVYEPEECSIKNKTNFFTKVYSANIINEITTDFSFEENICLHFEFCVQNFQPNLQIGIALLDKYNVRLFTILREIRDIKRVSESLFKGKVILPAKLIAPNNYSFVFALWTKDGKVFDLIENVSPVKIHDNGTELATYEGADYGSIIINPMWQND
jgi:lipopolysaccharide transport system ATP-binding protein